VFIKSAHSFPIALLQKLGENFYKWRSRYCMINIWVKVLNELIFSVWAQNDIFRRKYMFMSVSTYIYRQLKSINWKHNFKILDSVEDYARQWAKREKEDLYTLSEWVKSLRSLIQIIIKKFSGSMSTRSTSIFKDPNVAKHLSLLHDKYIIVSADKAPNNVFVCKSHYIDCLIKELGIDNSLGNPTYTPTTLTKEEILDNHRSVLCSFGISTKDEELDLPSLYWIPKLHKCPFKQRYIAGSAKCSTKPLSKLLICIL
jgi:hypothetical protein